MATRVDFIPIRDVAGALVETARESGCPECLDLVALCGGTVGSVAADLGECADRLAKVFFCNPWHDRERLELTPVAARLILTAALPKQCAEEVNELVNELMRSRLV